MIQYNVLNDNKKEVKIIYKDKSLKFRLKVKRSFTLLKKLLEAYPEFINIHSLDNIFNDPNRAHSELRISDGFANFLIENRHRNVMYIKLDIEKLFDVYGYHSSDEFIMLSPSHLRGNLSKEDKKIVYKLFNGKCNITGIKLYNKLKGRLFYKRSLLATYDHRRPLSKNGTNDLTNIQLISVLANDEKNKICNICDGKYCEKCALAFPEKYDTIIPNNQNINELRKEKLKTQ